MTIPHKGVFRHCFFHTPSLKGWMASNPGRVDALSFNAMTKVEALKSAVQCLTAEELTAFRVWLAEYDWQVWDRQIESDSKSGKFAALAAEALAEFERGETTEL